MSANNLGTSTGSTQFKSFISEAEVEERKLKRQEEWEKVRTAEQPKEAPEEEYDCRSLFDKLKEQKDQKDLEYEEAHKLKNMIRGLDDDEVSFLDLVDKTKENVENKRWIEEKKEIDEYRAVSDLVDQSKLSVIKKSVTPNPAIKKKSQSSLLAEAVKVKRKRSESTDTPSSVKASENSSDDKSDKSNLCKPKESISTMKCIGILPGVGEYDTDSTNSDSSSELEESQTDTFDMFIVTKKKRC